jgi:hypothetical protein
MKSAPTAITAPRPNTASHRRPTPLRIDATASPTRSTSPKANIEA